MSSLPKGAKVLITGGTSGIGAELVRLLRARGHPVIVLARRAGQMAPAPGLFPVDCDLAEAAARPCGLAGVMAGVLADHPDLAVLINNAGLQAALPLTDPALTAGQIMAEVAVNLTAPALLAQAVLPGMLARGRGTIVNISSGLAVFPKERTALYCAAKAGLSSLTTSLRWQVEAKGLRVVEVVLPLVDTPMTAGRGRGKISAEAAARGILAGLDGGRDRIRIGKARLLPLLARLAPSLGLRMMRRG